MIKCSTPFEAVKRVLGFFTKAFDMVDHIVLVKKLQLLGLRANIFNWLISFFTERVQYCNVNDKLCTEKY